MTMQVNSVDAGWVGLPVSRMCGTACYDVTTSLRANFQEES
jgi:hypothetical protein